MRHGRNGAHQPDGRDGDRLVRRRYAGAPRITIRYASNLCARTAQRRVHRLAGFPQRRHHDIYVVHVLGNGRVGAGGMRQGAGYSRTRLPQSTTVALARRHRSLHRGGTTGLEFLVQHVQANQADRGGVACGRPACGGYDCFNRHLDCAGRGWGVLIGYSGYCPVICRFSGEGTTPPAGRGSGYAANSRLRIASSSTIAIPEGRGPSLSGCIRASIIAQQIAPNGGFGPELARIRVLGSR